MVCFVFSVSDKALIATLISPAFYQPPSNEPMGRIERFGHIVLLHFLPLIVHVPCGILCHWFAKDSIGFGPLDSNTLIYGLIGSFVGGPVVYAILAIPYYGVSKSARPKFAKIFQHCYRFCEKILERSSVVEDLLYFVNFMLLNILFF